MPIFLIKNDLISVFVPCSIEIRIESDDFDSDVDKVEMEIEVEEDGLETLLHR